MKITNPLLFVVLVLGSGTLLLAQGHASPNVFAVSGTTVLSSIDTAGGMRADEVFALLSDSAGYSDPSANEADPPAESKTPPVSGATVLSSIDTAGSMLADEVFALLSDSAAYSDPAANTDRSSPIRTGQTRAGTVRLPTSKTPTPKYGSTGTRQW